MPTPLSNRLVHLEIRVNARDWCAWSVERDRTGSAVLHRAGAGAAEPARCPVQGTRLSEPQELEVRQQHRQARNGLDPEVERALFRGTVGEATAVQFTAFLKVWRELPHPRAVINDPANADIPENASTLIALCGSLYRMASDVNLDAIVTYATRIRREVGDSLVGACARREPALQRSPAFIRWTAVKTQ